ncbi:MAG: rhomboid family intramembrane serine protease [Planctomycetota bacterium]
MIPIRDSAPRYRRPVITPILFAANILVYMLQMTLPDERLVELTGYLAIRPNVFFGLWHQALENPSSIKSLSEFFVGALSSPVTYMFLHAGPMHLLGNMIFLWVFGDNVEGRLGRARFLLFYLLSGILAALIHCWMEPSSLSHVVGASGAIAGVLGAYFLLFPRAHVTVLVFLFVFVTLLELPAWVLLLCWFAIQIPDVQELFNFQDVGGVAYWAHLGGFLAGLALLPVFLLLNPAPGEEQR